MTDPENAYYAEIDAATAAYRESLGVARQARDELKAAVQAAYDEAVNAAHLDYEIARGQAAQHLLDARTELASCGHPRNADGECDCAWYPERAPAAPDA
jgi:hypothetical protein